MSPPAKPDTGSRPGPGTGRHRSVVSVPTRLAARLPLRILTKLHRGTSN